MNLKQSLMVCGAFLALTNGVVSAQTTATKTAKVYTVADAHLIPNGIGMCKPPLKNMCGTH